MKIEGVNYTWNHRVIEFTEPKTGEKWRQIHEVHYVDGEISGYGEGGAVVLWDPDVDGDESPVKQLEWMKKALEKAVIKREEFPDGGYEVRDMDGKPLNEIERKE